MTTVLAPPALTTRLAVPDPGWQRTTDVVIVGSGVGGLGLAHALARSGLDVAVVTKEGLGAGSTGAAQGGVATASGAGDSPESHLQDTMIAGAGLCDEQAVRILVTEGPEAVSALCAAGARFDLDDTGAIAFTREGGHSRARIIHAGGDATGREIQRALNVAIESAGNLTVLDRAFATDLLRDAHGTAAGVQVGILDEAGNCVESGALHARAVVLATGGYGQLFGTTTNPRGVTGDGIALALRAGAEVADIEFMQFHPTVFFAPGARSGTQLLISEAVRGEGAVLIDSHGDRVMEGAHPSADLAPRDVVSATMAGRMAALGVDHLFLDARQIGAETLLRRFPTIIAGCRAAGIDPVVQPIPVAPAAHYACGGVRADMNGRTSIPGLFAVGEVACTGVHGANRLASNSLLEGLVVSRRLAPALLDGLPPRVRPDAPETAGGLLDPAIRAELPELMARSAGVQRDPEELAALAGFLDAAGPSGAAAGRAAWEATNLHAIATALVGAAIRRQESRGCHRRTDIEESRAEFLGHIVSTVDNAEGFLRQEMSK
ncbi:MAG TPA: L-aspartate oxidase [Mycobacteriales bacterium]|nr:L-aspartate oxidase [Mycobacteriales bacterium]